MHVESSPDGAARHLIADHGHLRRLLGRTSSLLRDPGIDRSALANAVSEMVDDVLAHFRCEEEDGYFRDAVDVAPRLSRRADVLLGEHPRLAEQLAELRAMVESADTSRGWRRRLNDAFDAFLRVFRRHEDAENELLQKAYTEDIGQTD